MTLMPMIRRRGDFSEDGTDSPVGLVFVLLDLGTPLGSIDTIRGVCISRVSTDETNVRFDLNDDQSYLTLK
jgi:hypothetical protein